MVDGLGIEERLVRHSAETLASARHVVVFTGPGLMGQTQIMPLYPDQLLDRSEAAQEWSGIRAFKADPKMVWRWYNERKRFLRKMEPTLSHKNLAELENLLERFFLITQNTDGLHKKAGSINPVELHGSIWTARCLEDHYRYNDYDGSLGDEPKCPVCSGWLRPDVVWPGEPLPPEVFAVAREACENADLVMSIGCSADCQPLASLLWQAKATEAFLIEINPTVTAISATADIRIDADPEKALPVILEAVKKIVQYQTV